MQKIGGRTDFLGQMLDQLFGVLNVFGKLSRIFLCVCADSRKLHAERGQCLSRAIVQFPCYVPPLVILRLQEQPRKVTQVRVAFLKFLSTELHLRFDSVAVAYRRAMRGLGLG